VKEGLQRSFDGIILGKITLQNFLKQYKNLCGMTATADIVKEELFDVYGLQVEKINPNNPCIRIDYPDVIFSNKKAKENAIIDEISNIHYSGRPILVGTLTVSESEQLADDLGGIGIECKVLNVKQHKLEDEIIAQAGKLFAVTISTNMAGRGTDIRLGGHNKADRDKVVELGGL